MTQKMQQNLISFNDIIMSLSPVPRFVSLGVLSRMESVTQLGDFCYMACYNACYVSRFPAARVTIIQNLQSVKIATLELITTPNKQTKRKSQSKLATKTKHKNQTQNQTKH